MSADANRRLWTAGVFLWIALLGVLLQLRGALLPNFGRAFALSEGQLGLLSSTASLAFLPAVFLVGTLVSRLDVKRILAAGFGTAVVGPLLIAAAPSYAGLLAGMLVAGIASGLLHAVDRPIISHLYPARRGRMYNLEDMGWAVGATAGPLLATAALLVAGWRLAYLLLAAAFVPLGALLWRADLPASLDNERRFELGDVTALLGTRTVSVMTAAMLLLSFVESGVFTWLPYFASGSLPRAVANLSLSVFLAAYIPGRYAFSRAADRADNASLVLAAAVLAVPLLYLAFVVASGALLLVAVLPLGFLVAGMYPTLLAWGTNATPEFSGPVNAIALGTSSVGFLVFPAVMGLVAETYTIATAMQLPVVAMGILVALIGGARLLDGQHAGGR